MQLWWDDSLLVYTLAANTGKLRQTKNQHRCQSCKESYWKYSFTSSCPWDFNHGICRLLFTLIQLFISTIYLLPLRRHRKLSLSSWPSNNLLLNSNRPRSIVTREQIKQGITVGMLIGAFGMDTHAYTHTNAVDLSCAKSDWWGTQKIVDGLCLCSVLFLSRRMADALPICSSSFVQAPKQSHRKDGKLHYFRWCPL